MKGRRIYPIPYQFITRLQGKWELPEDAEVCEVHNDWQKRRICIVIQSDEFPELPEGALIPEWDLVVHQLEPV